MIGAARRKVAVPPIGAQESRDHFSEHSLTSNPPSDRSTHTIFQNEVEVSFWIKSFVILFISAVFACTVRNNCTITSRHNNEELIRFSSSHARVHLQRITSLGPRPAGSYANELSAADYLRRELKNIARTPNHSGPQVTFDEQISNYSSFQAGFHVSAYNNLRNFLLRIDSSKSNEKATARRAFLINCHYDSAVESPGASDDFVSCAIMLEVCRIFALGPNNLTNDLLFLFNGAEESILPSSHAFITQHPWAKEVVAFLNLEGAGSGGRLTIFQSGPGSGAELLVKTYSDSFAQPYGNVFAEELFQSGFIPSDTDFRIFRDFGRIPGLDMAYTSDGYCYHTRYDTESRISEACLQSTGDDILSFLRHIVYDEGLASIEKLKTHENPANVADSLNNFLSSDDIGWSHRPTSKVQTSIWSRRVYFDVLGVQLISAPWMSWKLVDWLLLTALACYFLYVRRLSFDRWTGLFFALMIHFSGQLLGMAFAYTLGYLTHHYGCRMSWYSARYNLIGIFVLPFMCWFFWFYTTLVRIPNGVCFGCIKLASFFDRIGWVNSEKRNIYRIERDFFDSALLVIALHLLVLDILNTPAAFVSTIWLASGLFGRSMYQLIASHSLNSVLWTTFILFPVCLFWHFYFCASFIEFFVPVFGRSGQVIKPDIAISVSLFYLISPITLLFTGMVQCSSASAGKSLRLVLLNACISYAVLVHASPFGFPYTVPLTSSADDPTLSPRFQRLVLFHTDRFFRDTADSEQVTANDSYVLLIPLDVNDVRFLKPNSYPVAIPSSILSRFQSSSVPSDHFGGLAELVNVSRTPCDRSRPYCGTPSLYPYIHFLQSFYHIPSHAHLIKPAVRLTMLSRIVWNNSLLLPDRRGINLTFSVISGPPHTHLLIRTDTPRVRLSNWSFHDSSSIPVPVPLPNKDSYSESTGAHYFVYHVNAEVRNTTQKWTQPWNFWLCLDFSTDAFQPHVDLAVTGIYIHDQFVSCDSPRLKEVAARLPPWVTTMSGCSSYEHYRFKLN